MNSKKTKNIISVVVILLITALCVYCFFNNSFYVGDDATFHINRIIGLANCFEEHQILPKIYPYANNGFGYATPLFYCDLFLYPFGILHHFGIGAVFCYKLAIIFYVLVGNIIIYKVIEKVTSNQPLAITGLILYSLSNYHLQNVLLRSAFGEILSMAFLPLVLYTIYNVLVRNEKCWILLGISFSLIVMSHLITTLLISVFFAIMIIVFVIANRNNKKLIIETIKTIAKGFVLALFLTAWYLLPMIEQLSDQTFWLSENAKHNDLTVTVQDFKNIFELFACNDLTNFSITQQASAGIVLLVVSILYVIVKKSRIITIVFVYVIILYLITIGILPYKYLNVVQFLFRNYIIITPLLTIISIYVLSELRMNRILVTIIIIFSIINSIVINQQVLSNGRLYLENSANKNEINSIDSYRYKLDYNHDELGGAEYLPLASVDYNNDNRAIKSVDKGWFINDYIMEWDYERNFTTIEFSCNNEKDLKLLLPISYYKGYKAYEMIDNGYVEIEINSDKQTKKLQINSSKGFHAYKITYAGTTIQKVTLLVSGVTFIGLIILLIRNKKSKANV